MFSTTRHCVSLYTQHYQSIGDQRIGNTAQVQITVDGPRSHEMVVVDNAQRHYKDII